MIVNADVNICRPQGCGLVPEGPTAGCGEVVRFSLAPCASPCPEFVTEAAIHSASREVVGSRCTTVECAIQVDPGEVLELRLVPPLSYGDRFPRRHPPLGWWRRGGAAAYGATRVRPVGGL